MLIDKRLQLEEKKQNFKSFLDFHDLEYPKQLLLMEERSTHIDHVEKVNTKPIIKQIVQLFVDKVSKQKQLDSSALAVDYISQHIDEFKLTQDDLNLILNAKPTDISIDQYQIAIAINNLVSDDERNTFKKLFNNVFSYGTGNVPKVHERLYSSLGQNALRNTFKLNKNDM